MAIEDIMKALQDEKFGVTLLSDDDSPCVVSEWISTGCLALDEILGGGLPIGRMVEVYGDASTGKSLIAAQVAAVAQYNGDIVMYIDTESAVSIPIMEAVGVDPDKLIYHAPDTVEDVFELMKAVMDAKEEHDPDRVLLIIWDSVAATTTKAEQEGGMEKMQVADAARNISKGLRTVVRTISKGRTSCLFLNQTRTKIGVMFGDNETTYGGKAMDFYSSIRVRLKTGSKLVDGKNVIGINTRAQVVKNKVAMPFKEALLPIFFGHGISDAQAAYEWLGDHDMLEGSGSWRSLTIDGEEVKFQRNGNWPAVFDEHYDHISKLILGGGDDVA